MGRGGILAQPVGEGGLVYFASGEVEHGQVAVRPRCGNRESVPSLMIFSTRLIWSENSSSKAETVNPVGVSVKNSEFAAIVGHQFLHICFNRTCASA